MTPVRPIGGHQWRPPCAVGTADRIEHSTCNRGQ